MTTMLHVISPYQPYMWVNHAKVYHRAPLGWGTLQCFGWGILFYRYLLDFFKIFTIINSEQNMVSTRYMANCIPSEVMKNYKKTIHVYRPKCRNLWIRNSWCVSGAMCFSTSHIIIFIKLFLSIRDDMKKPISLWFRYRCEEQLWHVKFSILPLLLQSFRWSSFIEKSHNKLFTNKKQHSCRSF